MHYNFKKYDFVYILISVLNIILLRNQIDASILSLSLLVDASVLVIIYLALGFTKKNFFKQIFFILSNVLLISDIAYAFYFQKFINVVDFKNIKWLFEGTDVGFRIQYSMAFAILLLILGLLVTNIIKSQKVLKNKFVIVSLVISLIIVGGGVLLKIQRSNSSDITDKNSYLEKTFFSVKEYFNSFGYFTARFKLLTFESSDNITDQDVEMFLNREFEKNNDFTEKYKDYNLISIQIETFDERMIIDGISHDIRSILDSSIVVDNYFVPEYQVGATCNSEYMAITGIFPMQTPNFESNMCMTISEDKYDYSLPNVLKGHGYDTYYIHNGLEDFYNRNNIIASTYGFDNAFFTNSHNKDNDMLPFLDEIDFNEKFYANFLTFSMHGGYEPGYIDDYYEIVRDYGELSDKSLAFYLAKSKATGRFIRRLIERLKEEGVYQNTLLVIYSDHWFYSYGDPEDFIESMNSLYGELGLTNKIEYDNINEIHHQKLYIHDAGETVEHFDNVGSTIDLVPTLLNMLVGDYNHSQYFGSDIFLDKSTVLFSDKTIYYNDNYYSTIYPYVGESNMDDVLKEYDYVNRVKGINDYLHKSGYYKITN